jgi:hypothetical protein
MNNDRLLTRVFDKQEKKMLYPSQGFDHIEYCERLFYNGLSKFGIICCYFNTNEKGHVQEILTVIPFGDRFVPMQCWGLLDKNKKLIYDDDIIKLDGNLYLCSFDGIAFGLSLIKEIRNILKPDIVTRNSSEIIGNRWEQPALMEVKA